MTSLPTSALTKGLIAFILLSLTGCLSYELGPAAKIPFKSIYIEPVRNESFAPQAQSILNNHIAQYFIRDGRVKIESDPDKADAALRVTITDYIRDPSVADSADTGRARSFGIELKASCLLVDLTNSKPYFKERGVEARINTFTDSGSQPSEYQDMPVLARKLAQRIGDLVLSAW